MGKEIRPDAANPARPHVRWLVALCLLPTAVVLGLMAVLRDGGGWRYLTVLLSACATAPVAVWVAGRTAELERRTDELARASRLKSEFLATMSHELRTPMNGIIGYTQVLLDGLDGPLTEEQREDLQCIAGSAERMLALINDMLDLSKMEAGRMALQRERTDLGAVLAEVLATVKPLRGSKPIRLSVDVKAAPPLHADPLRLRQILLNLVSNALKFTERGEVRITASLAAEGVAISVQDTGIGIPPEAHAYIFDEFRQVDSSHTRRFGGTGLGLSISRRLVEMHGGTIALESQKAKGSTFTFTMPVFRTSATVPQPGEESA